MRWSVFKDGGMRRGRAHLVHEARVLGSCGALHDAVYLIAEAVLRGLCPCLDLLRGGLCCPSLRDGCSAKLRLRTYEWRKRVEERADGIHATWGGVSGTACERGGVHVHHVGLKLDITRWLAGRRCACGEWVPCTRTGHSRRCDCRCDVGQRRP